LGRYFLKQPLALISLPCLWVIIEFLKENIWTGFGWANLGYSQYTNLYLIQVADIWGVKLISFLIVMVNVFLWEIVSKDRKNIIKKSLFVLAIFTICFSYSFYRLNNLKETDSIEVSVVQPNIPQELKWDPKESSSIIDKLENLGHQAKADTLIIFPEAAWPHTVNKVNIPLLEKVASRLDREIVMGAVVEKQGKFYNSALLFQRLWGDISLINQYYKIKLVPFGEYVPLRRWLSFIEVLNTIGDIAPGDKLTMFSQFGRSFAVLICFEDIFPSYVSQLACNSDFLVNITNDAWFGGNPQASQHLAVMTLRAVENRVSIVRAANTGISGWVSFRGEIEKLTRQGKEVFFPAVETFSISLHKERSFYTTFGELFSVLCGIFILGIFIKAGINREGK